jgi:hypothetical protein
MISLALRVRGSRRTGWKRAQLVSSDELLPLAAHIITSRVGYTHHGVHVGDGKVMHYAGLSRAFRRGPIMEVSLAEFSRGRPVRVLRHSRRPFTTDEVIARARSRLGEDRYRLFSNNCEHFCEWCIRGENRSRQVDMWRMRARSLLQPVYRLLELRQRALTRAAALARDETDEAGGAPPAPA